ALGLALADQLERVAVRRRRHLVDRAALVEIIGELGQRDLGLLRDQAFHVLFLDRNADAGGFLLPSVAAGLHLDRTVLQRVGAGGADRHGGDGGKSDEPHLYLLTG